ncbi:hypothetical protein [Phaffia rhodozyma]|uniref:Uncharacterized protein n=1 Tax=Phaffia rhodozyma TaxID=264483 RepID=A0A0F7SN65_PHARH|nr:hypothetical protein [Phaffia rhodozyma]
MAPLPFLQQSIADAILSAALRTLPSILDLTLNDLGYTGLSTSHDLSFQTELASRLAIPIEKPWDPEMSLRDVVQHLSTPILSEAGQQCSSLPTQSTSRSIPSDTPTRYEYGDDIINTHVSNFLSSISLSDEPSFLLGHLPSSDTRHLLLAGPDGSSLICALLERLTRRPFPSELETITVVVRGASTEEAYARLVGSLGSRGYNVPAIMGGIDQVDVQVIEWDGPTGEGLNIKAKNGLEGGVDTIIVCGSEDPEEDLIQLTLLLCKIGLARRQKNFHFISPRHGPCDFIEPPGSVPSPSCAMSEHRETIPDFRSEPLIEPPLSTQYHSPYPSSASTCSTRYMVSFEHQAATSIVDRIFFVVPEEELDAQASSLGIPKMKFIRWGTLLDKLKSSMYPSFQILSKKDWIEHLQSRFGSIEDVSMWIEEMEEWTEKWVESGKYEEEEEEESIINLIDCWVRDWEDLLID